MKLSLLCLMSMSALVAAPVPQALLGRWDLTVKTAKDSYPSWLEVTPDGVRIVGRVASVHPGKNVQQVRGGLTFETSEYMGKQVGVNWEIHAAGGKLSGTQKRADGSTGEISGVPATPKSARRITSWEKPKPLFNGKDMAGWEPIVTGEPGKSPKSNWVAQNGELVNTAAGANIRTTAKFDDFKLHVEFNCPQNGNSGVYLRGRYETQVEYEPVDANDKLHGLGAIYGFLAPSVDLPKKPGQWESFDITLVGRKVTVVRDGVTTIDNQEIPGITGGALDSNENEPGPIYIQGDHTGGMKYRNITIAVPAGSR